MNITEIDPCTFEISGRFDAHEVDGFRAAIDPWTARDGQVVRLDLTRTIFIDSTALAELVRATKHTRQKQGDVVITGMSDPVRVIMELTRLDRALSIEG